MGKLLLLFPSAVELCCVQTRIISCHIKLIYTKAVFPQWKFWNADACATESSTATGKESVTPLMSTDHSAMLTGGFFMHPFFVMPILKDCGRQAFCWVSDTDQIGSNILINHPFSSDTTCGDVRAQYFFVWGVSNPKSSILVSDMSLTGSQWSEISLKWSLRCLNGSQWLRSQLMKTLMNTSIYQIYLPHISYIYELYFQNCAINGWIVMEHSTPLTMRGLKSKQSPLALETPKIWRTSHVNSPLSLPIRAPLEKGAN